MRARLIKEGKWKGKQPTHSVPEQEEGEPAPKEARTDTDVVPETQSPQSVPETPSGTTSVSESTPESLPELESPPTAEGNGFWVKWVYGACLG